MSVLLPNAQLGVRRRASPSYDGHGTPLPGALGALQGPHAGRLRERGDGTWAVALDDRLWPVGQGDVVVQPSTGLTLHVQRADLFRNNADPRVDYIRVDALERVTGGTEPGGSEFATR